MRQNHRRLISAVLLGGVACLIGLILSQQALNTKPAWVAIVSLSGLAALSLLSAGYWLLSARGAQSQEQRARVSYTALQHTFSASIYALSAYTWLSFDHLWLPLPDGALRGLMLLLLGGVVLVDLIHVRALVRRSFASRFALSDDLPQDLKGLRRVFVRLEHRVVGDLYTLPLFSRRTLAELNIALLFIALPVLIFRAGDNTPAGLSDDSVEGIVYSYCQSQPAPGGLCATLRDKSGAVQTPVRVPFIYHVAAVTYQFELLENLPVMVVDALLGQATAEEGAAEQGAVYQALEDINLTDLEGIALALFKLVALGALLSFVFVLFDRRRDARELYHTLNNELQQRLSRGLEGDDLYQALRAEVLPSFQERLFDDPEITRVFEGLYFREGQLKGLGRLTGQLKRLLFLRREDEEILPHPISYPILFKLLTDPALIEVAGAQSGAQSARRKTILNHYADELAESLFERYGQGAPLSPLSQGGDGPEGQRAEQELTRALIAYFVYSADDIDLALSSEVSDRLSAAAALELPLYELMQSAYRAPSFSTTAAAKPFAKALSGLKERRRAAQRAPGDLIEQSVYQESHRRVLQMIERLDQHIKRVFEQASGGVPATHVRLLGVMRDSVRLVVCEGNEPKLDMIKTLELQLPENDPIPVLEPVLCDVCLEHLKGVLKARRLEEVQPLVDLLGRFQGQVGRILSAFDDVRREQREARASMSASDRILQVDMFRKMVSILYAQHKEELEKKRGDFSWVSSAIATYPSVVLGEPGIDRIADVLSKITDAEDAALDVKEWSLKFAEGDYLACVKLLCRCSSPIDNAITFSFLQHLISTGPIGYELFEAVLRRCIGLELCVGPAEIAPWVRSVMSSLTDEQVTQFVQSSNMSNPAHPHEAAYHFIRFFYVEELADRINWSAIPSRRAIDFVKFIHQSNGINSFKKHEPQILDLCIRFMKTGGNQDDFAIASELLCSLSLQLDEIYTNALLEIISSNKRTTAIRLNCFININIRFNLNLNLAKSHAFPANIPAAFFNTTKGRLFILNTLDFDVSNSNILALSSELFGFNVYAGVSFHEINKSIEKGILINNHVRVLVGAANGHAHLRAEMNNQEFMRHLINTCNTYIATTNAALQNQRLNFLKSVLPVCIQNAWPETRHIVRKMLNMRSDPLYMALLHIILSALAEHHHHLSPSDAMWLIDYAHVIEDELPELSAQTSPEQLRQALKAYVYLLHLLKHTNYRESIGRDLIRVTPRSALQAISSEPHYFGELALKTQSAAVLMSIARKYI